MAMPRFLSDLFGRGPRYTLQNMRALRQAAGPETMSGEVEAMQPKWRVIADVMEGYDAIKRGGENYLCRFEDESEKKFKRRIAEAPWRPVFPAAIESISSRPFATPVSLEGKPSDRMKAFGQDVDTQGNNLNVFARRLFEYGVTFGLGVFLVDFSRATPRADGLPLTRQDEMDQGLRPYWVHIPVRNLIDLRTDMINGREVVTHIRYREFASEYDGFEEVCRERIRMIELDAAGKPYWTLFEKQSNAGYEPIASGDLTIPEIPVVRFFTGPIDGAIKTKPPMYELARVSVEYYRALARQWEVENFSGWPILAGQGIAKDPNSKDEIAVGPNTVLFAPPSDAAGGAQWEIIGPDAALVEQVRKTPADVLDAFNKLAMQPTIPQQGVTATASGIDNSRAHSAIEAWANLLADALNNGLRFTSMWLGEKDQTTATVSTDFAGVASSVDEARVLGDAQKRGVISAKTERAELVRRSILGPDFDPDAEDEQLAREQEGLEPEQNIDPVGGDVLQFEREAS